MIREGQTPNPLMSHTTFLQLCSANSHLNLLAFFFFFDRLCKILLKIIANPKGTLGMNCRGKNLLANLDFRPTIIADKFNSDSLIKMKAMYWKKLQPLHKKKALKLTR